MGTDHLEKFFTAIDHIETPEWIKNYLLVSLFTSSRQSNVLAMSWGHLDLNLKLWMIPHKEMKNQEPLIIPLLDQVVKIRHPWKALLKRAWHTARLSIARYTPHYGELASDYRNVYRDYRCKPWA